MEFERDYWYWLYNPEEGDIFYPVYIDSDGCVVIDGEVKEELPLNLPLTKAVMPGE